jgi:hypothetical protein
MSKIRAITIQDLAREHAAKRDGYIVCDFCQENPVQFTYAHEGALDVGITDSEMHIYLFCGLCFFANVGHFLRMMNEEV